MKTLSFALLLVLASSSKSHAVVYSINHSLSGLQEVPSNLSPGTGSFIGNYDDATNTLSFSLSFSGLGGLSTAGHIHAPAPAGVNAPIIVGFAGYPVGQTAGFYSNSYVLTAAQEADLLAGLTYVNLHSNTFPGGEIRSQLLPVPAVGLLSFAATLTGAQEVPPNASTATGIITGTYDALTNALSFNLTFAGLVGTTTAAHFHAPAPVGVNAPVIVSFAGFPVGVSAGIYANTYILTPAQETDLLAGLTYVNVHTNQFPGGEIRAQLMLEQTTGSAVVPEPATATLGLLTFAALTLRRRRVA